MYFELVSRKIGKEIVSVSMEKPVNLQSKGRRLFGILHPAENNGRKMGIIFLNAGLQYRVGPHRIYVKAARRFSGIGFSVLRMDFAGIGESEGEIEYGGVDIDYFDIADTLGAIDFLTKEEEVEKIILLGICAGARNALKAAAKDHRVDSIISWSLPFIYGSENPVKNDSISEIAAKYYLRGVMKKALNVRAWKSYLFSDKYLYLIKNVFWVLGRKKNKDYSERQREFFEAFETFIFSGRKALFIYGEKEIIPIEEFKIKLEEFSQGKGHACELYIVPNGDHTFLSREAERDVIEKTAGWLAKEYNEGKLG